MKEVFMRYLALCLLAICYLMPSAAIAAEPLGDKSFKFIIFQKNNAQFEYDPIIFGDFPALINNMGESATVRLMTQQFHLEHGNVIDIKQDLLHEGAKGFGDSGIDCQLFFKSMQLDGAAYHIEGFCQINGMFDGKQLSLKSKVPMTELPLLNDGRMVWLEVYEDKRSGIAFYASLGR